LWDFGDGIFDTVINPTHSYNQNGFYNVCLYVYNGCGTDTFCSDVDLTIVGLQALNNKVITQRASNGFLIQQSKMISSFVLYDITGKQIKHENNNSKNVALDLSDVPLGCYLLELYSGNNKQVLKLIW